MRSVAAIGSPPQAPAHVAIIMDGNGRWAQARGLPRSAGHRQGAEAVKRTVRGAGELGIRHLTLFGFSSENWKRPAAEVGDLMGLLRHFLRTEIKELVDNGVRLKVLGERNRLASDIVELIDQAEATTHSNARIALNIAINYGSRSEMVAALRAMVKDIEAGTLSADALDEAMVGRYLMTAGIPDPDLVIRTSGEKRLSNFLLWQSAYAELMFVDTLWPDFGVANLQACIEEYHRRERRYGAVGG